MTVTGYLVILLALSAVAWALDKVLCAVIILYSYFFTRWVFPLTYHAKSNIGCITFTVGCFSIAIAVVLPLNLSIVASVVVGMGISAFLFALQFILTEQAKAKAVDEETVVDKCKMHNYTQLKTEIALKFFVENAKTKEVWAWLCNEKHEYLEYDSVKQMKWRMKKELFK